MTSSSLISITFALADVFGVAEQRMIFFVLKYCRISLAFTVLFWWLSSTTTTK